MMSYDHMLIWSYDHMIPLCYEGRKMGGVTPIPRQRIRQANTIISRIQSRNTPVLLLLVVVLVVVAVVVLIVISCSKPAWIGSDPIETRMNRLTHGAFRNRRKPDSLHIWGNETVMGHIVPKP